LVLSDKRVALGHRRLAIIDSPRRHHRCPTRAGRVWVTFNGEIYNYLELRARARSQGPRLPNRERHEVLLAAYREWGLDFLARD